MSYGYIQKSNKIQYKPDVFLQYLLVVESK